MLPLESRKRLRKVLERVYKAGEANEEEVLDGVVLLGDACMWVDEYDEYDGCEVCFERAKDFTKAEDVQARSGCL